MATHTGAVAGEFKYILCFGSTTKEVTEANQELTFKYILCFGST